MRCLSQVRVPSLPLNLTRARPCGTPALVAGVARYSGHSARARLVAECGKCDAVHERRKRPPALWPRERATGPSGSFDAGSHTVSAKRLGSPFEWSVLT